VTLTEDHPAATVQVGCGLAAIFPVRSLNHPLASPWISCWFFHAIKDGWRFPFAEDSLEKKPTPETPRAKFAITNGRGNPPGLAELVV
jgi:hypothetical protein